MTIKELIQKLQQFDPSLPVLLSGYEGGVYQPNKVYEVTIALNVNDAWYYGPHELVHDDDDWYPGHERTQGVYIK